MNGPVKRAKRADIPKILTVQKAAFAPVAAAHNRPDIPPMIETLEQALDEFEKMAFFKYVQNGRIIGAVRTCVNESGECYIGRLVVLPEYQCSGIGRALMEAVHAAYPNCTGFILFTAAHDNEKTIRFYNNLGYKNVLIKNENGVELLFMRRENC